MKRVCVQNESTNSDFIVQICKKPAFIMIRDLNFRSGFLTRGWKYSGTYSDSCKALHNSARRPGYLGALQNSAWSFLPKTRTRTHTGHYVTDTMAVVVTNRPDVTFSLGCHIYYNEIRKESLTQWTVGLIKRLACTRRSSSRWNKNTHRGMFRFNVCVIIGTTWQVIKNVKRL